MKYAHTIVITVFSYEKNKEDINLILEKLRSFVGINLKKEKLCIDRSETIGFNEKKIFILSVVLEKDRHIRRKYIIRK